MCFLFALGSIGCSDAHDPSLDAAMGSDAFVDASSDASADAAAMCGTTFPTFERTCTSPSDCVAVTHTLDCCGSKRVMGIASREQARFGADEAACAPGFPACGCPAQLPAADDGTHPTTGHTTPTVLCSAGQCATTFVM
jgi:hypothetical protein